MKQKTESVIILMVMVLMQLALFFLIIAVSPVMGVTPTLERAFSLVSLGIIAAMILTALLIIAVIIFGKSPEVQWRGSMDQTPEYLEMCSKLPSEIKNLVPRDHHGCMGGDKSFFGYHEKLNGMASAPRPTANHDLWKRIQ